MEILLLLGVVGLGFGLSALKRGVGNAAASAASGVVRSARFMKNYAEGDSMYALADRTWTAQPLSYAMAGTGPAITGNVVLELQQRLKQLAARRRLPELDPGRPDGSLGAKTASAIRAFQTLGAEDSPKLLGELAGSVVGFETAAALGFAGQVTPAG